MENQKLWQMVKKWKDNHTDISLNKNERKTLDSFNISINNFKVAIKDPSSLASLTDITDPWKR